MSMETEYPKTTESIPGPIPIPTPRVETPSDWEMSKLTAHGIYIEDIGTREDRAGGFIRLHLSPFILEKMHKERGNKGQIKAALEISGRKYFGESFVESESWKLFLKEGLGV
jgi:hypothetical protein